MSVLDGDHDNLGFLMGYPVYESSLAKQPLVLRPTNGQVAVVVPNYREFENELWIEMALHKAVRENMGDTLEWIHGPGASRWWVGSKSRYSHLMIRLQLERAKDDTITRVQEFAKKFAPVARVVSRAEDGLSNLFPVSGYTRPVDFHDITDGN